MNKELTYEVDEHGMFVEKEAEDAAVESLICGLLEIFGDLDDE